MDQSRLDAAQLQKRDPAAWTALLRQEPELADVQVTAVSAQSIYPANANRLDLRITRYLLTLDGYAEPIPLVGKQTNLSELLFYREIAPQIPTLAPRCWYCHLAGDKGWVVLDDVPRDYPPPSWSAYDVEAIINDLTDLHITFWGQYSQLQMIGLHHFIGQKKFTLPELQEKYEIYFTRGPATVLSTHAMESAGALAPVFLEASNGLAVIQSLDGWPGILGESHMAAAADLLDDPLPMLQPLHELPVTLVHGNPFSYHWRLTFLDERRLIDWQKTFIGPGIYDLVSFIEQFDLLYQGDGRFPISLRSEWPTSEETIIDGYLLTMSARLGRQFDARAMRLAIPAARCLHVITNWFPHFATWFSDMPNRYAWQKINRMSDEQLAETPFQPMVGFRPYLATVFQRFLRAYRML